MCEANRFQVARYQIHDSTKSASKFIAKFMVNSYGVRKLLPTQPYLSEWVTSCIGLSFTLLYSPSPFGAKIDAGAFTGHFMMNVTYTGLLYPDDDNNMHALWMYELRTSNESCVWPNCSPLYKVMMQNKDCRNALSHTVGLFPHIKIQQFHMVLGMIFQMPTVSVFSRFCVMRSASNSLLLRLTVSTSKVLFHCA